ncbi:MAG: hypothetical protein DHS20C01_37280 [marine bacterium B5-7]|nr:MAG: hypothetical protein DHS20C01_37280 [marine bacterium B5-7]
MKDDPFGVEFAEIRINAKSLTASGVAIGNSPVPYRLDYVPETRADFVTSRLHATCHGEGWCRNLDLCRDDRGVWTILAHESGQLDLPPAGGDTELLGGALDCDIELSPVTNMMPIYRHGLLHGGGPIAFTMAWVAVPALSVQPSGQQYSHVRTDGERHIIRYESIGSSFAADIIVDDDAVVIDYPGVAQQLI